MLRRLEQLLHEDKLRDLRLFSLEKRRVKGDFIAPSSIKGGKKGLEREFLQGHGVTGKGVKALKCKKVGLDQMF